MSNNEVAPTRSDSIWRKAILLVGGITLLCCFGMLGYFGLLFYVVDRDVSLIPSPTLDPNCGETTCLNACLRVLPDFVKMNLSEHKNELDQKAGGYVLASYWIKQADGKLYKLANSPVPSYLQPYQDDTELHARIWKYTKQIFDTGDQARISYITFYADTHVDRYAASVWMTSSGKWTLNVNLAELGNAWDTLGTILHEHAHILTLDDSQVTGIGPWYDEEIDRKDFDAKSNLCGDQFFTGAECARDTAYINEFGKRFWHGQLYEDWVTIFLQEIETEERSPALDEFYLKYQDQFVTAYAATNPSEDIAESWSEFILRPKPAGDSIAQQKILFFYEYPELVQLRGKILSTICQFAVAQTGTPTPQTPAVQLTPP